MSLVSSGRGPRAPGRSSSRTMDTSDDGLGELALRVAARHVAERRRLDLGGLALAAELQVALAADLPGGLARWLQVVARVELLGVLGHEPADRRGHREADV